MVGLNDGPKMETQNSKFSLFAQMLKPLALPCLALNKTRMVFVLLARQVRKLKVLLLGLSPKALKLFASGTTMMTKICTTTMLSWN